MKFDGITADIVKQLEEGTKPWTKTWTTKGSFVPYNASTSTQYRGITILLLWSAAMKAGYGQQAWMGFKQASSIGASVRKGEKASRIVFFNYLEQDDKRIPYSRLFNVFNVAQLENLPAHYSVEPEPLPPGTFQTLLLASQVPYRHGPRPCYYPGHDMVEMPNLSEFTSETDWLSTFGHELVHASGHKSRLDRKFEGEDKYGWEELVAELGSAFIAAALGHSYNDAQSPAYLAGWLKVLKQDPRALFTIASHASKAAEWFLEREQVVTADTLDCEKELAPV